MGEENDASSKQRKRRRRRRKLKQSTWHPRWQQQHQQKEEQSNCVYAMASDRRICVGTHPRPKKSPSSVSFCNKTGRWFEQKLPSILPFQEAIFEPSQSQLMNLKSSSVLLTPWHNELSPHAFMTWRSFAGCFPTGQHWLKMPTLLVLRKVNMCLKMFLDN